MTETATEKQPLVQVVIGFLKPGRLGTGVFGNGDDEAEARANALKVLKDDWGERYKPTQMYERVFRFQGWGKGWKQTSGPDDDALKAQAAKVRKRYPHL